MTVKDLEARLGIPRANIRYYESEGLLSPRRLSNGYRDYSEEDAAELSKIKLLRGLRLDIETIRLIQKGTLPLDRALFNQLTRLEGDRTQAERAAAVCRELERSGVEYAALDAAQWLPALDAPECAHTPASLPDRPKIGEGWREDNTDYARFHPWRRWLARGVDNGIWFMALYALLGFVFRADLLNMGGLAQWVIGFLGLGANVLTEPLLLHFWGWTPGKWIFGLKVRDEAGEKLSLPDAWNRSVGVFSQGFGFNLPVYSWYRAWKSYKCCDDRDCPWDVENGVRYTHEGRRGAWAIWLGCEVLQFFLTLVCIFHTQLPPNRGPLTVPEYCQNLNFYLSRIGSSDRVDDKGRWVEDTGFVISFGNPDYADLSFELTDGAVTAVTLADYLPEPEDREEGDDWIWMGQSAYQTATLALAGAQERLNCFTFAFGGWDKFWTEDDRYDTFTEEFQGLRFVQAVTYTGFDKNGYHLNAKEGQEGQALSYRREVTISLVGDD